VKVFEKPGPANTDEVVEICKVASPRADYVVVASVTGASALKIAEKIKDRKIVCVTCPQGMYWQVNEMKGGLFEGIVFSEHNSTAEAQPIDTDKFSTLRSVTISALVTHNNHCVNRCYRPHFGYSLRPASR
jgi:hypothetical protein